MTGSRLAVIGRQKAPIGVVVETLRQSSSLSPWSLKA